MKLSICILFISIYCSSFSQKKITAKIYGDKSSIKYIKVSNKTTGFITYSDEYGNFNIIAKLNDSLFFESSFYEKEKIKIDSIKLNEKFVVQLKEKINELEEVVLKSNSAIKTFNTKEFNIELKNEIALDIKKNPHLYRPPSDLGYIDFFQLISYIIKLFNKKNDKVLELNKDIKKHISYEDFDALFLKSNFFNEDLLTINLNISKEHKYLFFDFCEAKNINSNYLKENNSFLLLNELIKLSKEFISRTRTYENN
jgi:hypothetical protein